MPFSKERAKARRQEIGATLQEIADKVGVSKQTIQRYESGKIEKINTDTVEQLASALQTTAGYLMEWEDSGSDFDVFSLADVSPIQTQTFPMLGEIACGEPTYASDEFGAYVSTGQPIAADFCLKAKGDSMTGARIFEGDIVFIRKQEIVENGEIAAVLIGDDTTLKRVRYNKEAGELLLIPENPTHITMRFLGEELNRIRILGKAVAFMSDVR